MGERGVGQTHTALPLGAADMAEQIVACVGRADVGTEGGRLEAVLAAAVQHIALDHLRVPGHAPHSTWRECASMDDIAHSTTSSPHFCKRI